MNPITGESQVVIGGKEYTIRFDWSCLAEIESAHGDNPNFFNPKIVADIAAIGMKKKHPEMTEEKILELSPPLMPFATAVQRAMRFAYFGNEAIPEDNQKKNLPKTGGLLQHIKRLFVRG